MKRTLGLVMAFIILVNTFMGSVMQAYALAPVVYGYYQLVEAYMGIYGITNGYGDSVSGFDENLDGDIIHDMSNAWLEGSAYTFANGSEIGNFFEDPALFIEFIDEVYQMTLDYNAQQVYNEAYYALNDKSYAASGTLVSKTLAYKLGQVLDYVQGPGAATLERDLQSVYSATTQDDAVAFMTSAKSFKYIMDGIITAYMAYSVIGDTNTWSKPIQSDCYSLNDLHQIVVNYNGVDYEIYNTKSFSVLYSDTLTTISANEPFILVPYITNNMSYHTVMSKNVTYVLWTERYNSTGALKKSQTVDITYNSTYDCYFRQSGLRGLYTNIPNVKTIDANTANGLVGKVSNMYMTDAGSRGAYLGNGQSMADTKSALEDALSSFWDLNGIGAKDIIGLSDTLGDTKTDAGTDTHTTTITDTITRVVEDTKANTSTDDTTGSGTGSYSSILDKILAAILALATTIWSFFAQPILDILDSTTSAYTAVVDIGKSIITLPKSIWEYFEEVLVAIQSKVLGLDLSEPWQGDNESQSLDFLDLVNGLILLIMILFMFLKIFVHCLEFIINIFAIPASTAMLPDEMVLGLNHLKSLVIPGIGLSVYDFMMGLVYILIVFYAIRILRVNVDRIRMPKKRSGGF